MAIIKIGEPFCPYKAFKVLVIPEPLVPSLLLSWGAKVCLARLYKFSGDDNHCFPWQSDIAKSLGVSLRTVRRYLFELVDNKFIKTEQRGPDLANKYWMLAHESLFDKSQQTEDRTEVSYQDQDRTELAVEDRTEVSGLQNQDRTEVSYQDQLAVEDRTEVSYQDQDRTEVSGLQNQDRTEVSGLTLCCIESLKPLSAELPEENLSLEDFKKRWNFYPKRPWPKLGTNKQAVLRYEQKWQSVEITVEELDEELEAWKENEWAISHDYTADGFLGRLANRARKLAPRAVLPPPTAPAPPLAQPRSNPEPELDRVAESIRESHPPSKRCGVEMVKNLLKTILANRPTITLVEIERKHQGNSKSEDWTKDRNRYAPKLSKYLEYGGEDMWDNDPPPDEDDYRSQGYYFEEDLIRVFRGKWVAEGKDGAEWDRLYARREKRARETEGRSCGDLNEDSIDWEIKDEQWELEHGIDSWTKQPLPGWSRPVVN